MNFLETMRFGLFLLIKHSIFNCLPPVGSAAEFWINAKRLSGRGTSKKGVLMVVALFGCVLLPAFFVFPKLSGYFRSDNVSPENQSDNFVFTSPVKIQNPNSYLSVRNSEHLIPHEEKDFLFFVWLKIKKLPLKDEKMLLLSKFDPESRSRKGFAFSLSRELDVIRPEIYWRDNDNGTWFKFSEAKLTHNTWTLFVVTLRNGNLLGLHYANVNPGQKTEIKPLGGYEFTNRIYAHSNADLTIGSLNSSRFRGQIGGLGILTKDEIDPEFNDILWQLLNSPLDVPDNFSEDEVKLWVANGVTDKSIYNNQVSLVRSKHHDVEDVEK